MDDARMRRRGFLAMAGATVAGIGRLLAGAHARAAAGPRLTVGPIRRVGADGAKYFEPWIAANPRDASNLVVVGSHRLDEMSHKEPAAWFTTDGGATWSAGELAGADQLRREKAAFADAYATYAPDGTAFCVFLGSPNGKPDRPVDLPLRRRRPTLAGADDRAGFPGLSSARRRPARRQAPPLRRGQRSGRWADLRKVEEARIRLCGPEVGRRRPDASRPSISSRRRRSCTPRSSRR